jgi:hypothetical protein
MNSTNNSRKSATATGNSELLLSRDARLVSSLGPLHPGDKVTQIEPPHLKDILWLNWQTVDGTDLPRPYFPSNTAKKPPSTAVYTLAPGSLVSGGKITFNTDCVLGHGMDLKASQIIVGDPRRGTRRQFSYGNDKRDTAFATVASKTMAMRVELPQGGDEFHLTLDPTQTGKQSMRGVTKTRNGQPVPTEKGVGHVCYKFKNGVVTEWDDDDDKSTIQ